MSTTNPITININNYYNVNADRFFIFLPYKKMSLVEIFTYFNMRVRNNTKVISDTLHISEHMYNIFSTHEDVIRGNPYNFDKFIEIYYYCLNNKKSMSDCLTGIF